MLELIDGIPLLSVSDSYLRSEALVLLADLESVAHQDSKSQAEQVDNPHLYMKAHSSVLSQVTMTGAILNFS